MLSKLFFISSNWVFLMRNPPSLQGAKLWSYICDIICQYFWAAKFQIALEGPTLHTPIWYTIVLSWFWRREKKVSDKCQFETFSIAPPTTFRWWIWVLVPASDGSFVPLASSHSQRPVSVSHQPSLHLPARPQKGLTKAGSLTRSLTGYYPALQGPWQDTGVGWQETNAH